MPKLYGGARRGSRKLGFPEKFGAFCIAVGREMRHDTGRKGKITHESTPLAKDLPTTAAEGASACF
jgi:hypothetical protein